MVNMIVNLVMFTKVFLWEGKGGAKNPSEGGKAPSTGGAATGSGGGGGDGELADTVQKLIAKRLKEKLGAVADIAAAPTEKPVWHYCPRGHPLCEKTDVCWACKWCPEKEPAPIKNPDEKKKVIDVTKAPTKDSVDGDRDWSALAAWILDSGASDWVANGQAHTLNAPVKSNTQASTVTGITCWTRMSPSRFRR